MAIGSRSKRSGIPGVADGGKVSVSPSDQRVKHFELRKGRKIAVGRPELAHTVVKAERGDARVVDLRPSHLSHCGERAELLKVPGTFCEQLKPRAGEERVHKRQGLGQGGRWLIDARMRCYGQKLVNAGPGKRPRCGLAPQGINGGFGCRMKRAVLAVRIDQQVGIEGNHAPRAR